MTQLVGAARRSRHLARRARACRARRARRRSPTTREPKSAEPIIERNPFDSVTGPLNAAEADDAVPDAEARVRI